MQSKVINFQIKDEKVPHYDGLALFFNGQKVHYGVFVSIRALRKFWHEYRDYILAGRCQWNDHASTWQKTPGPNSGLQSDLSFRRYEWFDLQR